MVIGRKGSVRPKVDGVAVRRGVIFRNCIYIGKSLAGFCGAEHSFMEKSLRESLMVQVLIYLMILLMILDRRGCDGKSVAIVKKAILLKFDPSDIRRGFKTK